ncbi:Extracellular serine protease [Pandoraea sp. SD6-2]|nr:Extracellular serine protease [Pandoraea sp. SD6-2]
MPSQSLLLSQRIRDQSQRLPTDEPGKAFAETLSKLDSPDQMMRSLLGKLQAANGRLDAELSKLSDEERRLVQTAIQEKRIATIDEISLDVKKIRPWLDAAAVAGRYKALPEATQRALKTQFEKGEYKTVQALLVDALPLNQTISDERHTNNAELYDALNRLSGDDRKLVIGAILDGRITLVEQGIAAAKKLALAETFDALPQALQQKLLAQYASGQFESPEQLSSAATSAEAQLLNQDRRQAMPLPQMAFAAEYNAQRLQQSMRDRLNGNDAFMYATGAEPKLDNGRRNAWAQVAGGQSIATGNAGSPGFSLRGAGVTVGADTVFNDSRVGVALGYANSTLDASGLRAKAKVDTFSVGLYGSHNIDTWFANVGTSYSGHAITSDRTATVDGTQYGMSAKTHADTVGGFVELGKKIEASLINVTPSLTAKFSETSIDGFSESGIASSTANKSKYASARVGLGMRLWQDFGDEERRITPSIRIVYEREVADSAPSMDVVLHGINGLAPIHTNLSALKLGRDILSAEAAVAVKLSDRLSANAAIVTSWRRHETQVGANGSLIYHW